MTIDYPNITTWEHSKIEIEGRYDKRILVVGQVSDDMSIKYGAFGPKYSALLQMG